jgi:phage I-like protein
MRATFDLVERQIGDSQRGSTSTRAVLLGAFREPADGEKREAPSEFRIFHYGVNQSEKGDFLFDEASAESVMEAYAKRGRPLMMDYEHQTATNPPQIAIASATEFTPEIRQDADGHPELWATQVKWTKRAREYLENGEYRLYSPLFLTDKSSPPRILELRNVALTNLPALEDLEPLVAATSDTPNKEPKMPMEEKELTALQEKCAALEEEKKQLAARLSAMENVVKQRTGKSFDDWAAEEAEEHGEEEGAAMTALAAKVIAITGKAEPADAVNEVAMAFADRKELVALRAKATADAEKAIEDEFTSLLALAVEKKVVAPADKILADGHLSRGFYIGLKADFGTAKALEQLKKLDLGTPMVGLRAPRMPAPDAMPSSAVLEEVARACGANIDEVKKLAAQEAGRA